MNDQVTAPAVPSHFPDAEQVGDGIRFDRRTGYWQAQDARSQGQHIREWVWLEPVTNEQLQRRLNLAKSDESLDWDFTLLFAPAIGSALLAGLCVFLHTIFTALEDPAWPFTAVVILARVIFVICVLGAPLFIAGYMLTTAITGRIRYRREAARIVATTKVVTGEQRDAIVRRRARRRLGLGTVR